MIYIILLFLGLCLGSFINALVWRLHQQSRSSNKKSRHKYSISKGRSMCVHCEHELTTIDLVPVFSWLLLRGKCRYCNNSISPQYPLVEVLTAVVFILSYAVWPTYISGYEWLYFSCWLMLLVVLIALFVYDIRHMLLPNKLVIAAAVPVLIWTLFKAMEVEASLMPILQAIYGLLAFGGVFYLLFVISGGKWIGGGDVKLGYVLGAWLASPLLSILAIFLASLIGTIIVAVMSLVSPISRNTKLPFGPMLIAGFTIAFYFGQYLIDDYSGFILNL